MNRADLIRILMNTELEEHPKLTRKQARAVVNEIFKAIAEALQHGEVVHLPIGAFGVYEQDRKPMRGWILGRVRVLYKQRNWIKFRGDEYMESEYDQQPADQAPPAVSRGGPLPRPQPPHRLDSKGVMKPSQTDSPPKISPPERRTLVAVAVKAGKSQRLIAHELNVAGRTVRRDLELLGISADKKPTATRRKPAVVLKANSGATAERKVLSQIPPMPPKPAPLVVREPQKPEQPKPEIRLSPEELRRQRLEEMLKLVKAWFVERGCNYRRAENVLDKARNHLTASHNRSIQGLPEPSMAAEQLLHHTRPQEMDAVKSQNIFRQDEVCALWLARWLAAWAPHDNQLRNNLLNKARSQIRE